MRANVLSGSYAFIGREEGNSPFYTIVRDHYSKLLTPFEAIERPASFMALMRLDDNFKILSPEGTIDKTYFGQRLVNAYCRMNYSFLICLRADTTNVYSPIQED